MGSGIVENFVRSEMSISLSSQEKLPIFFWFVFFFILHAMRNKTVWVQCKRHSEIEQNV